MKHQYDLLIGEHKDKDHWYNIFPGAREIETIHEEIARITMAHLNERPLDFEYKEN